MISQIVFGPVAGIGLSEMRFDPFLNSLDGPGLGWEKVSPQDGMAINQVLKRPANRGSIGRAFDLRGRRDIAYRDIARKMMKKVKSLLPARKTKLCRRALRVTCDLRPP